ncbi:hypothetical protein DY000_02019509 [Brassica cretica]|uniref:C2 tensin-type domain-containing protein n=1 Tax=Brassica cretica TaxID=69181 RepID=A0ABQ7CSF9_BRACR|nr:hypothetical protein DY000_02019509 [Brassica cretica]
MSLFRKHFYRKAPDRLVEISEHVYAFDCCFSCDVMGDDEYKLYLDGIVAQLHDHYPDASFMVCNFRAGYQRSRISTLLSQYRMWVMDYPNQQGSVPLLPLQTGIMAIRRLWNWHITRVLYMELLRHASSLNPRPSQLRYLQYISTSSEWPSSEAPLLLDCLILKGLSHFEWRRDWRPSLRVFGQDPKARACRSSILLFSTPKTDHMYKQEECILVMLDIQCRVQGDIVLEFVNLSDNLVRRTMMDILWDAKDEFPKELEAELLFSNAVVPAMSTAPPLCPLMPRGVPPPPPRPPFRYGGPPTSTPPPMGTPSHAMHGGAPPPPPPPPQFRYGGFSPPLRPPMGDPPRPMRGGVPPPPPPPPLRSNRRGVPPPPPPFIYGKPQTPTPPPTGTPSSPMRGGSPRPPPFRYGGHSPPLWQPMGTPSSSIRRVASPPPPPPPMRGGRGRSGLGSSSKRRSSVRPIPLPWAFNKTLREEFQRYGGQTAPDNVSEIEAFFRGVGEDGKGERSGFVDLNRSIRCFGSIVNRASNNNLRVACLVSNLFGLGFTDVSVPTVLLQKPSGSSCRDLRACLWQLQDHFPYASLLVFNFREGDQRSQISDVLSQHDMTVMDYPSHYQNYPLLPLEMIHHFLKSSESWLSLEGQQNVLAFMLSGLLLYRKQYQEEQKTLEMVQKQAPKDLLHQLSPLNSQPSQLRYLHYISRRNLGPDWPPSATPLLLDCLILRDFPHFEGNHGTDITPTRTVKNRLGVPSNFKAASNSGSNERKSALERISDPIQTKELSARRAPNFESGRLQEVESRGEEEAPMDQDQTEDQITGTERIPAPLRLGTNSSAKKNRRDGIPIAAQSKVASKRRITNPLKKCVARSPLLGLNQRRVTPVRASTSARRKLIVEKDKEIPCDKGGINFYFKWEWILHTDSGTSRKKGHARDE